METVTTEYMKEMRYVLSGTLPNDDDMKEFVRILEDPFIRGRYTHWRKTGNGQQGYPSDPLSKEISST